jgi:hypothetical protein
LVEQVSSAAVPVTLAQPGHHSRPPPTIDLTVYRVVQESLTNVIKHTGPLAPSHLLSVGWSVGDRVLVRTTTGSAEFTVAAGLSVGRASRATLWSPPLQACAR